LLLKESFQQAIKQKSVFGFSEASIHAMKGLSLIHRISEEYEVAKGVLFNALSLASDIQDVGIELESDLLLDLGGLYLDQKKSDDAEIQFFKAAQLLQQSSTNAQCSLRVKSLEGLAAVHFQKGSLQAAENFLGQVIEHWCLHGGTEGSEYLAAENILGMVYRAQGDLIAAASTCTRILSCQEEHLGLIHHESLRTMHNLAGILVDKSQFSEAVMLYRREILGLEEILGSENPDTLRTVGLLARAYYGADDIENAVTTWRRVAEVNERSFGLANMSSMESRFQLAKSLGRLRGHHEAIKLLEALVPYNAKILGHEHPMSRRTKLLLANLSRRQETSMRASTLRGGLFDEVRITSSDLASNRGGRVKGRSSL
jgi:tetratricopeptide (TPR) repeat protein